MSTRVADTRAWYRYTNKACLRQALKALAREGGLGLYIQILPHISH